MQSWRHFRLWVALAAVPVSDHPAGAEEPGETWLPPAGAHFAPSQEQGETRIVGETKDQEFTIESQQAYPAKTGDSFELKVRLKAELGARALPELACHDGEGHEISAPSPLALGNPNVSTEWQSFRRLFVVRPGTANVRARIRGTGRGTISIADLEFGPKQINAYETGALITQPHAKRRQGVVRGERKLGGSGYCARRLIRPAIGDLLT